jgi:porphobilinogen synthase
MRRLRRTPLIRELVREVTLAKSDLVQPLFVEEGLSKNAPISSMPGQNRFSLSSLEKEASELKDRGVRIVLRGPVHTTPEESFRSLSRA